jgi:hypothetical protein
MLLRLVYVMIAIFFLIGISTFSRALPSFAATGPRMQKHTTREGAGSLPVKTGFGNVTRRFSVAASPLVSKSPNTTSIDRFQGLSQDSSEPSDVNAAIGPDNAVEVVNSKLAFYDRNKPHAQLFGSDLLKG